MAALNKAAGVSNAEIVLRNSALSTTRSPRADLTGQIPVLGFVLVGFSEVGRGSSNNLFSGAIESTTVSTKLYSELASTASMPFPNHDAVQSKLIFARVKAT
ncbi:unannotated protein [freshwater metagenome]|uniref:Unannotated protein n=1 Tax=freshwater metagenome TaxID=449393 RepID=A0A6J6BAH0_9ZZZZ